MPEACLQHDVLGVADRVREPADGAGLADDVAVNSEIVTENGRNSGSIFFITTG